MDFAQHTVGGLLQIAEANDPHEFRAYFIGAILANVVGQLPENYWKQFTKCEPCGTVGCLCHERTALLMAGLKAIRLDHQQNAPQTITE